MTVGELLRRMTSAEIAEQMAFSSREPFPEDYLNFQVRAISAGLAGQKHVKMPNWWNDERPQQSEQDMLLELMKLSKQ